jgi:hypothetical protein
LRKLPQVASRALFRKGLPSDVIELENPIICCLMIAVSALSFGEWSRIDRKNRFVIVPYQKLSGKRAKNWGLHAACTRKMQVI